MRLLRGLLKFAAAGGLPVAGGAAAVKSDLVDLDSMPMVRFSRAASTAFCIGIEYKMLFRKYDKSHPDYAQAKHELHLRSALRLRDMCCKNGCAFIKVGQHLGSLDYLFPEEYVSTMKILYDRAPHSPVEELKRVIYEDLGKEVEEMFVEFDPEPLGAASLAQVHRAKLADGREVAVKIQHPKVEASAYADIRTMEFLVNVVGWIFPNFRYDWLVEETKKNLPVELDFLNEGRNCIRVKQILKKFKFLKVPEVYMDLSSNRVLTMEFCEGGKVDDLKYMKTHNINVDRVTERLGQLYSEMIFVEGYVHCDPHPGNVLVRPAKDGPHIVLLDHGLYQTLTDEFRVNYSNMWMSMINSDKEGMKKYATALNVGDLYPLFACVLTGRSWKAIEAGIDRHKVTKTETEEVQAGVSEYLSEISSLLGRVPRQMLLLLKTNDVLRGVESSLKSHPGSASFINMSKCCVQAVGRQERLNCSSWSSALKVQVRQYMQLARITLYSYYLKLLSSRLGVYLGHSALYS